MSENGAKTVAPPAFLADQIDWARWNLDGWKPPHDVRKISCQYGPGSGGDVQISVRLSWVKPKVKGLDRYASFHFVFDWHYQGDLIEFLDHLVESEIDRIVHADSLKLLARGNRSQRADTDRFEAEQKLKGELCPV